MPVRWDPSGRSGHGLVNRMMRRWRQCRTRRELFTSIVVEPVLTRFEARDDWVPRLTSVLGCMLFRGVVAASNVTALRATSKVKPPSAGRITFHTSRAARFHRGIDCFVGHVRILPYWPPTSRRPLPGHGHIRQGRATYRSQPSFVSSVPRMLRPSLAARILPPNNSQVGGSPHTAVARLLANPHAMSRSCPRRSAPAR